MKTLLSTCLLWALFSTGASLQCYSCFSTTGPCDDSSIQQCIRGEDTCITQTAITTLLLLPTFFTKYCVSSAMCKPGSYSITTLQNTYGQITATCCKTDLCNKGTLQLPNMNLIPNGQKCPGCYSLGSRNCQPTISVPCTGKENQCLRFSGSISTSLSPLPFSQDIAFQGCTTPNTCNYQPVKVGSANNAIMITVTSLECKNATMLGGPLTNSTPGNTTLPLPG
ncbi:phospholipase A2 inhibitor and Ly6/PLAUR domain-containing protein-like [Paroedura picta]|uniref:phospholipase A2 inhibitor and Ly6/PLAUR domain-containing protein-like n=1 Tax=Paroedura picta TaxID=143630 RepID=UPI004055C741